MAGIDISRLPRNIATHPFHRAAEAEGNPAQLTERESLIFQFNQENACQPVSSYHQAENFLSQAEPSRAERLRQKASNLFGVARLLTEGSDVVLFSKEGKTTQHIGTETYLNAHASAETPEISPDALQRKAEGIARENHFAREQVLFNERMDRTANKVQRRRDNGNSGLWWGGGILAAFVSALWVPPLAIIGGIAGSSFLMVMSFTQQGREVLKEIRLPFWS